VTAGAPLFSTYNRKKGGKKEEEGRGERKGRRRDNKEEVMAKERALSFSIKRPHEGKKGRRKKKRGKKETNGE